MTGDASDWLDGFDLLSGSQSLFEEALEAATDPLGAVQRRVDPLRRLLDPAFTDLTWEDDEGRIFPGSRHAKQMEAQEATAKRKWLFWGNQSGKTTCGGQEWALLALGRHPTLQLWQPPLILWASALTWELWENILLPELLLWLPPDRVIDAPPPRRKSTKRTILVRADNGKVSRIIGKAAQQGPELYQSERIHGVWTDEEHPEPIWNELQPRLLRFGGISLATMTPLKGLTWVYHRVYEPWKRGALDAKLHFVSHAGVADNPSITPEALAALEDELKHNPSQLAARKYGHFVRPEGLVLPFDPEKHYETLDDHQLTMLLVRGTLWCGIDFGLWRFAFVVGVVDRDGVLHVVAKVFSQRESTGVRAQRIHDMLSGLAAPASTIIAGDSAAAQDILDTNTELANIGSPYRVSPVTSANKARLPGVKRMENLLHREALLIRRDMDPDEVWMLGWNASRPGMPVQGCRLAWEINNWRYPRPPAQTRERDERAQGDDPDDNTADGADCMDALRYLVMTWFTGPAESAEAPVDPFDPEVIAAEEEWQRYDNRQTKGARRIDGRSRNRIR